MKSAARYASLLILMTSFGDVIIPADASKHSGDIRRRHNSSSNNLLDARGKSLSSAAHVGYEFNGENNLLASDKGQFSIGLSSTVKEMMRRCLSCLSVCMYVCLSVSQLDINRKVIDGFR